ncbi:hypothetical protein CN984_17825 [Bacillus cereus]|uniref:Uncharacterized protein n=1 Tax=Bacillus cereus TaxID=1396 RepID=A0A2B9PW88_BACCE|nr:hypothetical protein [Bacillus cereus]PGO26421.1 hypothetical protein CN984_17825 [Bacillus cereus]
MFLSSIVSYLGAWEELNEKYPEEYADIIRCIENLHILKKEGELKNYKVSNDFLDSWESSLKESGWLPRRSSGLGAYFKSMVAVRLFTGVREIANSWLFSASNKAIKRNACEIPILILLTQETLESFENPKHYMQMHFERFLLELQEIAPLNLEYPFLILAISNQEMPLEMVEMPSNIEGYNENIVMNRSIEFPPEYYQAGLGILGYFQKVLKEKYPGIQATVRIIQDGLIVKMIVETEDGSKHIVEKALEEYDLILKGEIKPEEYFDASAQIQILELKNELRMAQFRIESQKELLAYQKTQIKEQQIQTSTLVEIISKGLSKPALPAIHVSPVITVETSLSQHTIHNELKEAIEVIRDLKKVVDSPETVESLNEIEEALSEADANNINDSAGVSKLQSLIETVNNTESAVSKSIATTTAGVELAKKLARNYNKLAPWCGLPQIPFIK